jgi:hypothetical protein
MRVAQVGEEQPAVLLTAQEVAELLRLSPVTVYEAGRRDPCTWGVCRFGRAVRFRRDAIEALIRGPAAAQER